MGIRNSFVSREAYYGSHFSFQVIARSDSEETISKGDCRGLWARNDDFSIPKSTLGMIVNLFFRKVNK
jgi:hypothetical protein